MFPLIVFTITNEAVAFKRFYLQLFLRCSISSVDLHFHSIKLCFHRKSMHDTSYVLPVAALSSSCRKCNAERITTVPVPSYKARRASRERMEN